MEFVVPLLIVVLVIVIGLVIVRLAARNRTGGAGHVRKSPDYPTTATSKEAAAEASARLNQQQHTAIYALIAQGQALSAIREYRNATGAGLREATGAVAQMSAHPQPYKASPDDVPTLRPEDDEPREAAPEQPREDAEPQQAAPAPAPAPAEEAPPQESAPAPRAAPRGYRYRAIVSKGETIREIASTRLNDDVFDRIRTAALGGDREDAVRLLLDHSEATEADAREFVDLIGPEEES
jgi:FtsZ-interacting cell division protein ZipA